MRKAASILLLVGWSSAKPRGEDDPSSPINRLKADLHKLSFEEAKMRFGEINVRGPPPPRQNKVDHFVVLYMENHAADNFFGCMDLPGFDGIKGHKLPKDPSDPSKGTFEVTCGKADYVCKGGPGYDTFAGKFPKTGAMPHIYPYSEQSDVNSALHGATEGGVATTMYGPEQIPIKSAIAQNFGVFNKLYTAVPSASSPNHLFTQSATSCGMQHNGLYNDCLGPTVMFPQFTIYDNMRLHNVSFEIYLNSTCGLDGTPCHGEDPHDPDSASAINTPDVAMAGVARHIDRFISQTTFYQRAANGSLPQLSWLLPPLQACDHPCYDVAKGERLLKDVYEALRAGPGWNKTLLFVAYDDAGGYYDHVVPPMEGVPADEAPCHLTGPDTNPPYKCPGGGNAFDFRRLGLRTSAMLIGPMVPKGGVFQTPKGPYNTSQFELTSVPATVKNLFNLSGFLTKRDAWAGSFDELLLDKPRPEADCPLHLPEAPKPAAPWNPPPPGTAPVHGYQEGGYRVEDDGDDDGDDIEEGDDAGNEHGERRQHRRALSVGVAGAVQKASASPPAQHCSSIHGEPEVPCAGVKVPNLKQRRNLRLLSQLTNSPEPDVESMTFTEADRWIGAKWKQWIQQGAPFK
jgi:phospholipase C